MGRIKFLGPRWLGLLLLADFAIVCVLKAASGKPGEIWWMSHVGLLIAGLGLVCRSTLLICTALISVFVVHSFWLVDCAIWLVTGNFVLGVTKYLEGAELRVWLATTHHFYLIPLLAISVLRRKQCPPMSLLAAMVLFLAVTLVSRVFVAPEQNVNFAFRVETSLDWPILLRFNRLPGPAYVFVLNALVSVAFFLPTFLGLRHWCARSNQRA